MLLPASQGDARIGSLLVFLPPPSLTVYARDPVCTLYCGQGSMCRCKHKYAGALLRGIVSDAAARAMHVHDTLALDRAHETKGKMVAR